jgi:hypothetical protein
MQKLTRWFNGSEKPVREGVYEIRHRHLSNMVGNRIALFAYYSLKKGWSHSQSGIYLPSPLFGYNSIQDKEWRGILK